MISLNFLPHLWPLSNNSRFLIFVFLLLGKELLQFAIQVVTPIRVLLGLGAGLGQLEREAVVFSIILDRRVWELDADGVLLLLGDGTKHPDRHTLVKCTLDVDLGANLQLGSP